HPVLAQPVVIVGESDEGLHDDTLLRSQIFHADAVLRTQGAALPHVLQQIFDRLRHLLQLLETVQQLPAAGPGCRCLCFFHAVCSFQRTEVAAAANWRKSSPGNKWGWFSSWDSRVSWFT